MNPSLIYDVGLHKGEDTDFYLKKGFRVIGFEADPELASHCRSRFALEIGEGRLTIVEGAIVDPQRISLEKIPFFRNQILSAWGTAEPEWKLRNELQGAPSEEIYVSPIDFGEALSKFGTPYYCKIDVEGADFHCLRALAKQASRPRFISIESAYNELPSLFAEIRMLWGLGFQRFSVVQQSGIAEWDDRFFGGEGEAIEYSFSTGSSGPFGSDLQAPWGGKMVTLARLAKIFLLDKAFADKKNRLRGPMVQKIRKRYEARWGPLGWYDIHARVD